MKHVFLTLSAIIFFAFTSFSQKTKIIMNTDSGRIVLMLYDGTPKHRDNMIKLVKQHFYDSILFHRVIPEFMVQTGDPDSKHAAPGAPLGEGDVGYRIPAEIQDQYFHARGALGAARDGNPEKASSGCQFYIVVGKKYTDAELDAIEKRNNHKFSSAQRTAYKTVGGTPFLDGNYTVFGEVVEGQEVADKISKVARNASDRPNGDIHIRKMYIKKKRRFLFF